MDAGPTPYQLLHDEVSNQEPDGWVVPCLPQVKHIALLNLRPRETPHGAMEGGVARYVIRFLLAEEIALPREVADCH